MGENIYVRRSWEPGVVLKVTVNENNTLNVPYFEIAEAIEKGYDVISKSADNKELYQVKLGEDDLSVVINSKIYTATENKDYPVYSGDEPGGSDGGKVYTISGDLEDYTIDMTKTEYDDIIENPTNHVDDICVSDSGSRFLHLVGINDNETIIFSASYYDKNENHLHFISAFIFYDDEVEHVRVNYYYKTEALGIMDDSE